MEAIGIPLIITMIPLIMVLGLSFVKRITASLLATIAAASSSVIAGIFTPIVAVYVAAGLLSSLIPDDQPKCLTGAVTFFPIGGTFTFFTLLAGINLVYVTYTKHRKPGRN